MITNNLIDGNGTNTGMSKLITKKKIVSLRILYLVGGCDQIVINGLNWFSLYNLITFGNLSTNSIVQNRTLVCGSYISSSSATFGGGILTLSLPSIYTFQLNGQMTSGLPIQLEKGSFGVGTTLANNIIKTSSVQYTLSGRNINMNGGNDGATINQDNNLSNTCQSVTTNLKELSQIFSQLSNTSGNTVSIPTGTPGPLNLYVKSIISNGLSIFNLDGNTVFSNSNVQQIEIIVDSNISSNLKLILINLSGTDISFTNGNLVGNWLSTSTGQSHTVWNFPKATKLLFSSSSIMGTILAPYAQLSNTAQISGTIAVDSLIATAGINNPPIILPYCL